MKQRRLLLALSSLLLQATTTTTALEARNPVRIFLLAGDDAAEGYASIDHLRSLIVNASTPSGIRDRYVHLVNDDDNEFRTRHDAFVAYDHILDDDDNNHEWMSGPISQVFFGATPQTFGPELEMGHVLGNAFEEPIVIVKAAWRQASLADDFVAPNGPEYKHLLESVQRTIDNLEDVLTGRVKIAYKDAGHVLSGVVWFQGYSDLRVKQYRDSYREHLTQFLTDLRRDLQPYTAGKSSAATAARLLRPFPIIVGELGGMGTITKPVVATPPQPLITAAERWQLEQSMRETQRTTVASHADAEHLYYVYTARYHRPTSMLLEEFRESVGDHEESPSSSAEQLLLPMQDYMYYNGRADTMIDIGGAFASALLKKLEMDYEFPPKLIKAPLNKPFDLMGSMHLHSKSNATVEAQEEQDEDPNMLLSDEMAFTEVGAVELVLGVVVLIIGLFVFILMMQVNPCCRRTCGSSKKYGKEQPDKKKPLRQAMESSWRATVETLSSIVRAMNLEDELEEEEEEWNDFDAAAERSSYKCHHSDRYQAVDNDVVMTPARAEYIASKIKKQAMKQAKERKFKVLRQEEEDGSAEHVLENSGLESPSSSGLDAVTTTPPSSAASSVPAVATSSWLPGTTRKLPKFSSSSKWRRSRNKENRNNSNNNEARTFAAKHYSNDIDVLVV